MNLNLFLNMLTPIKKQGDEHIYILLQFDIIDWMSVRYMDIHRFVWMLISSVITGIHLWRSSLNPATSSSTWCWFQTAVAIKQKTSDDFFDLVTVSGVFGKYAKKSKLVVWLV